MPIYDERYNVFWPDSCGPAQTPWEWYIPSCLARPNWWWLDGAIEAKRIGGLHRV